MNLNSQRSLTWGTVAAAVLSALWLALTEPGGFEFARDAWTEITSGDSSSTEGKATGARRPSPHTSRGSDNDAETARH